MNQVKISADVAITNPFCQKRGKNRTETIAIYKLIPARGEPIILGSGKFPGRWSPEKVLNDLRMNPTAKRYKFTAAGVEVIPHLAVANLLA